MTASWTPFAQEKGECPTKGVNSDYGGDAYAVYKHFGRESSRCKIVTHSPALAPRSIITPRPSSHSDYATAQPGHAVDAAGDRHRSLDNCGPTETPCRPPSSSIAVAGA